MTSIIQTEKLTKSYGSHRGIVDLDLSYAASGAANTDRPKQAIAVANYVLGKIPG